MAKIGHAFRFSSQEPAESLLEGLCPFKKHRGETWLQVLDTDPAYIEWLLFAGDVNLDERLRDELTWALEDK